MKSGLFDKELLFSAQYEVFQINKNSRDVPSAICSTKRQKLEGVHCRGWGGGVSVCIDRHKDNNHKLAIDTFWYV